MHQRRRQQSAIEDASTSSVYLLINTYCNSYIIFIMCNVNINLTLQFFAQLFTIYKSLTFPYLGYSYRWGLYRCDAHQLDYYTFIVILMSVRNKKFVISSLGDYHLFRAKKYDIIFAYGSLSISMLALEKYNYLHPINYKS